MERTDELKERIRQQPLNDRLEESRRRIGDMCSKGRCPKMTIPVQHDDDDFYINTTLADAQATIAELMEALECVLTEKPLPSGEYVHLVSCNGDRRKPAGTIGVSCSCRVGRATIAALQARLDEQIRTWWTLRGVETPCEKCSGAGWRAYASTATWRGGIGGQAITNDVCDKCWGSGDIYRKGADIRNMEAKLTQRTAELEAAKADKAKWEEIASLRFAGDHKFVKEMELLKIENANLQAELERVRGERDEANEIVAALSAKVAEYEVELNGDPQNFYGRGRTVGLRTLIAALPKVEGEIEVYTGKNTNQVVVTYNRGIIIGTLYGLDHAKPVADLYKHRQGMEG